MTKCEHTAFAFLGARCHKTDTNLWKQEKKAMFSFKDVTAAQVGVIVYAGMWSTFVPGYFQPEQMFRTFYGKEPQPSDVSQIMQLTAYCGFFGLTCAAAALDATASELVLAAQTAMCAFFLRFHSVVSPQLGVYSKEKLTSLKQSWGVGLAIGLAALGWNARMKRSP